MKQDKATTKTFMVDSNPAAAEQIRQWLLSQLKEFECDDDDVFAVQLAFQEAFYNAIEHGNEMDTEKTGFGKTTRKRQLPAQLLSGYF